MSLDSVTDQNFEEYVLDQQVPVLVDFWATWCGPCRSLTPTLERLAQEYDGRLLVVKLDVDANPEMRRRYNVRSIPRMILFKDGREAAALLGAHGAARIKQMVDQHVPPAQAMPVEAAPSASVLPAEQFQQQGQPQQGLYQDPLDEIIQPMGRRR